MAVLLVSTLFLGAAVSFAMFARYEAARVSSEEFAAVTRGLAMIALKEASEAIVLDDGPSDSRVERIYSGEPFELDFSDFTARITIDPLDGHIPINGLLLPEGVAPLDQRQLGGHPLAEAHHGGGAAGPGGVEGDGVPVPQVDDQGLVGA